MPLFKIKESATGRTAVGQGITVHGTTETEHGDGTVDFRVQDSGTVTRDGDLVRVPKGAVRHIDDYDD